MILPKMPLGARKSFNKVFGQYQEIVFLVIVWLLKTGSYENQTMILIADSSLIQKRIGKGVLFLV